MPQENADETYSVIYAALKHPVRRRILRMLNEEEFTYTQMLNKLDLDTGHLNYYLEGLGELLAKTADGKYRLSEFGKAAVRLMAGVEETEPAPNGKEKNRFSRRRIARLSQVICVIALILSGAFLMSINTVEEYYPMASGSLDSKDLQILSPNATISSIDNANTRHFHTDTLTTRYRTFFQIEIYQVNVSLNIQVAERIYPMGQIREPPFEKYYQDQILIYNQTWEGPGAADCEDANYLFSKLTYTIKIPIKSPQEKGMLVSNSFAEFTTTITNIGDATLYRFPANSSGKVEMINLPNNTGSFNMKTYYLFIERTDYPYFCIGTALIVLAIITAMLPYLPMLARKTAKTVHFRQPTI